jgi:hypothetical protein
MFVRAGSIVLNRADINDPSIQTALQTQDLLSIQLFDDVAVTAMKTSVRNTLSGGIYWTGNTPDGELTLFIQNNYLQGTLHQGNQVFDITSDENGNVKVVELDTDKNPTPNEDCFFKDEEANSEPDVQQSVAGLRAADNFPTPSTDNDGNFIVDILVLYPTEIAMEMGATPELRTAKVNYYMEEANEIFIHSKINVRFRLAHDEINNVIPKDASSTTDVSRASGVNTLRDLYGADIVSHWNYNGSAGIGTVWTGTKRNAMYNTSKYSEVISRYTFVHECGHNLSAHHDRYEYMKDGPSTKDYSI